MAQLTNLFVSSSYQGILKLQDSSEGLTSTLQPVTDGLNNPLPILVSTTDIIITGSFAGDGSNLTGITFDTSSIDTRIDSKLDSSSFENYSSSNDSKVNSLINATGSYLTDLPDGLVSGSSQISYTGLSDIPNGIVSGSGQISFNGITDVPEGIVTSSNQISYTGITDVPSGIVSGSEQISFNGITDIPTGLVSGSEQISFNSISDVPDGLISGSSQISDLGYATTGSNTFNGDQIISGTLEVTGYITGDGSQLTGITFDSSSIVEQISTKLDSSSFESYTSSNDQKVNSLIQETGSYITNSQTGSMTVASSSHSEYAVTASFAMNGGGTPIDTSTFATTGSNTFNGNQIIKGSIEPTTIKGSSESSGNVWLDFNEESIGCTTPNPYLNQLTNGVNLIFPRRPEITSICSGRIEVSGSSNIILQGHLVEQSGRKGYLAGYGNFVQNVPTINTSSLATITMGNNFISNPPSLTYDSGTHFITSNVLVGGTYLNHVSASASPVGSNVLNNINTGTINSNASGSLLSSSLIISNNIQAGTVTLRHIKSPIRYSNNMEVGSITVNNNFEGTGSQHFLDISNNFIGVSTGIVDAGGSSSTNVRRRVNDNFIGGNNVYLNLTESGSDAGNISSTLIYGNSLNVYGKQTLNGLDKGSAYLGRYNLDYGPTADPRQTIVAVGVGTSIANRKTGFWITSGSTVGIDGALEVTGSINLTGIISGDGSGLTNLTLPSDLVSGSGQISYNGITDIPSGLVSGSAQIDITQTTGYDTFSSSIATTDFNQEQRLDSLEGALEVTGSNLTVKGDFMVKGTTTIIDSTTVDIKDNIIQLNGSGATNGGLVVRDATAPNTVSGSILWDTLNDKWIAGQVGFEDDIVLLTKTQSLSNKTINGNNNTLSNIPNSGLTNSSVTINGTSVSLGGSITSATILSGTSVVSGSAQISELGYINSTQTGSMSVASSSYSNYAVTASYAENIPTIDTSSLATTGSNTFVGNQIITGSVTATSFIGDGSLLTNLPTQSLPAGVVSGSSQISFNGITDVPTGLVSGSSQVSYTGLSNIPTGIVSGSGQVSYTGLSNIPSGIVSSSAQISYTNISDKPSNLISGSSQISALGFATTGSNSFNGTTIMTGSLEGNVVPITITSNTGSMDCGLGNFFTIQLVNASTHIIPTNINKGQTISILASTVAGNTVTFPSSVKQPSGSAYTPTNGTGKDVLTFISFDTSTIYLANTKNLI